MRNTEKMKRIAANYSGNAALCAILIMIMLLSVGTAALVVTGRSAIDKNSDMPTTAVASSIEDTSSEDTSSVEEEPEALMTYPEKDFDFLKMELENVTAKYSVLLDCDNNTLYTARNYKKKCYPASLTKIMTVIVALENCDDLSDTYKFTKADIKSLEDANASVAGFVAGEKVTVEDLLYGAMLPSGADATLGLANYVAGSEEAFVELMNDKVEELGLTGTHFTNASGLHDDDHYTTAMDIALMIEYALNNSDISEEFVDIISTESYTTSSNSKNENGITLSSIFFQRYEGYFIDRDEDGEGDCDIVGGKTGFTDESQYSLASVYQVDGSYFVCVTLKSESSQAATEDNIAIAERYLPTYDLISDLSSEDDSSSTVDQDSSLTDTTPSVIDQTDSTDPAYGGNSSSSEADSSSDTDTSTSTDTSSVDETTTTAAADTVPS